MRPFPLLTGLLIAILLLALIAFAVGLIFVTQPMAAPIASKAPPADPERLKAHVRRLSVDMHPRNHEEIENLDLAALYIRNAFAAAGGAVSMQPYTVGGRSYKNVMVRFGPAQGAPVVIGAHYDSHDQTPGADDNASGVAGLLELARLFGQQPPMQPVELVAYPLEEPPYFRTQHMGSARHAAALVEAKRQIRLMVALEMIGYFSDEVGSQSYPLPGMSAIYPSRGNYIAVVGKLGDGSLVRRAKALMTGAGSLPVESINAPTHLPGIDFSDHLNYWNHGMPAIMVTDTAFMRNRNYHQLTDTWDTLDYKRMALVVQAVYALANGF